MAASVGCQQRIPACFPRPYADRKSPAIRHVTYNFPLRPIKPKIQCVNFVRDYENHLNDKEIIDSFNIRNEGFNLRNLIIFKHTNRSKMFI